MPYALCSDLHAHAWGQFSTIKHDGINSRLHNLLAELDRMTKEAEQRGCKRIYVAGDIFHVRGQVKPSVLNPLMLEMESLAEQRNVHWILMPGNHDLEGSDSAWLSSAIEALGASKHITVISDARAFHNDRVVMVPWYRTRDELDKRIREISAHVDVSNYDLILHTGINGVLIGVPDHGWAPAELADYGFKRVFSGHYHAHKVFTIPRGMSDDTHIVSIGSLTHQTWSDVGTKAGWLIVEDEAFSFHENVQPKFMDFDPDRAVTDYIGNYVRVQGIELEEDEIRSVRNDMLEAGVAGVVVHAVAKSKVVSRAGTAAKSAVTMEGSISAWIKSASIADADEVERAAIDVLNKARSME